MYLSDLQEKDIVDINNGKKVGRVIDAKIDNEGKIIYLVIDSKKSIRNILSNSSDINISFNQIKKIGEDVILIDLWYNITRERG